MTTQTFFIEDMHCTACIMTIDGALEDLVGVQKVDTSFAHSRTRVEYDPREVTPDDIMKAVRTVGYEARLPDVHE